MTVFVFTSGMSKDAPSSSYDNRTARKKIRNSQLTVTFSPILRIGDQVPTFDVFWSKHLQEVRSTVYIHVQSM